MHTLANDLTVTLQADRPGALAAALEAIARAGIHIDGHAEIDGTLHLLTRDAAATQRALRAAGIRVRAEREVLVFEAGDRPGMAAGLFRRIADGGVNVAFSYVATDNRIVVGADDPERAAKLLE